MRMFRVSIGSSVAIRLAVLAALCAVALAVAAAPAFAEGEVPWWQVIENAAPTNLTPGGTSQMQVVATNLGDAVANGSSAPITVSDRLPAGIVAIGIKGLAGVLGGQGTGECSLEAVSCTFAQSIAPYHAVVLELVVRVERGVQSGALNEAVVEGGGATRVRNGQPLTVGAAGSHSLFGVEAYEIVPESVGGVPDTQAGSHPFQLTTTLHLNQVLESGVAESAGGFEKDLRFYLPPGLIGNPQPVPRCPSGAFFAETCPLSTVIGAASVTLIVPLTSPSPITIPVPLYNLAPQVGEPARFGFIAFADPVILDTAVRTGGDYGVVVTVHNISQGKDVLASQVTFWGAPGDPRHNSTRGSRCLRHNEEEPCEPLNEEAGFQPLLTLPTSCSTPWTSTVAADSWAEPAVRKTGEYSLRDQYGHALGLSGCNRLTFDPSVSFTPDGQEGSEPTGLTVGIHVPQTAGLSPNGEAQATVKNTTVTLPAGVVLNPAAADGLSACSTEQVGLQSAALIGCPESSKIATVEIRSPLLPDPLVGAAYLAAQNANPFGSLVAMYIVAEDAKAGVLIKLAGEVRLDPVTGQIVSTFKETPQLPFEDLSLHFFGGSRAPLGTPALCGGYTTTAAIEPWSGTEAVDSSSEFQITSGPNHTPCHNPLLFTPSLTAGMTSIQAGGFSPFTMTMSREDGEQNLQSVQLKMPPGLSGTLSTVKLCGEPQADQGTCGPESLIGETIVSVGLGGNPFSVTGGKVYITGPYRGAPYGLSIVNPAKAGPFDVEHDTSNPNYNPACDCLVVRAKIEVDQETAQLTITTDPSGPYAIPHILDGIPLAIQHVNVLVNRPNFTFNPTNCSPLTIGGSLGSDEGASAALAVPFQATNCAVLAFKPKLEASTTAKATKANGTSLHVKLSYEAGPYDANIAKVKVELPKALPSRLTTLQKACTAAVFEANPAACPAGSIVGQATATTPVLPVPLNGPAYFVSHGGEAFPSLIIVLQGYGVTVHLVGSTFINEKTGITSSTFKTVPDVPVGTFELTLPQGPYSALTANTNLCKKSLAMPTEFVGQNGALIQTSTKIAVAGCTNAKTKHKHTHKHKAKKTSRKHKAKKAAHKKKNRQSGGKRRKG